MFMQTYVTFHDDLFCSQQCMDYAHYQYAPSWFISAFVTSISDCLLSRQDLVSNIRTDVVDKSFSDSN